MNTATLDNMFFHSASAREVVFTSGARDILSRAKYNRIRIYYISKHIHRYFEFSKQEVSYTDGKIKNTPEISEWMQENGITIMLIFSSIKEMAEFKLIS